MGKHEIQKYFWHRKEMVPIWDGQEGVDQYVLYDDVITVIFSTLGGRIAELEKAVRDKEEDRRIVCDAYEKRIKELLDAILVLTRGERDD